MSRGENSQPDDVTRAIARELRVEMARKDVNQAELVRLTGMSQSMVHRIVRGTKVADIVQIQQIAEALRISWIDLVGNAQREVLERTSEVTVLHPKKSEDESTVTELKAARRNRGKLDNDPGDDT